MAALERLTYSPSVGLRDTPFSAAEYDKNGAVLALTVPTVMVWALWDCPVVGWTLWAQSEDEWISTPFG